MSHPFFVLTPCFLFVPRSLPSVLFLLSVSTTASFLHQLFFISDFDSFSFASFTSRQLPFLYCLQSCCFLSCICLSRFTFLPRCFHLAYFLYCSFSLPPLHLSGFRLLLTALSLSFFCPLPVLQALHLYRQLQPRSFSLFFFSSMFSHSSLSHHTNLLTRAITLACLLILHPPFSSSSYSLHCMCVCGPHAQWQLQPIPLAR